jgi:hypothetical protein
MTYECPLAFHSQRVPLAGPARSRDGSQIDFYDRPAHERNQS